MIDTILLALKTQLENQVVSGGLILGLIAAVAAALRKLPFMLWSQVKRALIVTAVIDSRNDLFNAAITWLDRAPAGKHSRFFTVIQSNNDEKDGVSMAAKSAALNILPNGSNTASRQLPKLLYSPAPGMHIFWHKGVLMWIEREIQMNLQVIETLRISALFAPRKTIEDLLQQMLEAAYGALAHQTVLWTVDRWAENWQRADSKPRRPIDSVVLTGDKRNDLLEDVAKFFESRDWYAKLGVPWRRGYLFYGPPGTGKTSLAFALAGHLNLDLCLLSLTNNKLTDQNIAELLQKTPSRSIILVEDIDAFFNNRDKVESKIEVSFSGLLNAIDGVAAQEGRLVVLTTNHRDKLDPALIRPGRIDKQIELDNASTAQAKALFLRFFPNDEATADEFQLLYGQASISPASIQQSLISSPNAQAALAALQEKLHL
jgi:mitochondrial chaperone BCS1